MLPVCLWQENPNRLVSLWDIMQRFKAEHFTRVSSLLGQFFMDVQGGRYPSDISWKTISSELPLLEKNCEELGLVATATRLKRLKYQITTLASDLPVDQFGQSLIQIQVTLNDELAARIFLAVQHTNVDYYTAFTADRSQPDPNRVEEAWTPIFLSFASTKYDATESFKCYALGRNTACVFHLMRVLELGLTALGQIFGVSLAHTNWAPAIEKIESHIREMHKDPVWKALPDCKEQQEFYSQAASHFGVLKDAWRNYTAHVRGKYDEQEAADIMTGVRAFMQKLASKGLHE